MCYPESYVLCSKHAHQKMEAARAKADEYATPRSQELYAKAWDDWLRTPDGIAYLREEYDDPGKRALADQYARERLEKIAQYHEQVRREASEGRPNPLLASLTAPRNGWGMRTSLMPGSARTPPLLHKFVYGAPVVVDDEGNEEYWEHGHRHRSGGKPAVVLSTGHQEYWEGGLRHRLGGLPAVIARDGSEEYWEYGVRYR